MRNTLFQKTCSICAWLKKIPKVSQSWVVSSCKELPLFLLSCWDLEGQETFQEFPLHQLPVPLYL